MLEWFNGKKTVIGACCLWVDALYQQVYQGIWHLPVTDWSTAGADTASWVGLVLGGVGLSHKGVKLYRAKRNGG